MIHPIFVSLQFKLLAAKTEFERCRCQSFNRNCFENRAIKILPDSFSQRSHQTSYGSLCSGGHYQ